MKTNEFDTHGMELIQTIAASTNSNNMIVTAGIVPTDMSSPVSESAQALIDDLFSMS